jgi:lupus La protein
VTLLTSLICCPLLVEFYFSDSNLPFDKFLFTQTLKNPEGYVPLATVSSFKRMRDHQAAYGVPFIAQAVREKSNEVAVDDKGEMIRRAKRLQKDTTAWERSVYVVSICRIF